MNKRNLIFVIALMLLTVFAVIFSSMRTNKSADEAVSAQIEVEPVSVKTEMTTEEKAEEYVAETEAETEESAAEAFFEEVPVIEEIMEETSAIETLVVEEPVNEEVPVETVKVEIPPHEGELLYSRSFEFRGRRGELAAYSDYTEVRLAAGTEEDLLALAALVRADSEELLIQDGTVYVKTPQLLMSASEEEPVIEEFTAETPAVETAPVVEEVEAPVTETVHETAEVIEETAEVTPEEEPVLFFGHFSYKGFSADIEAYPDYAFITVPAGTTDMDVNACAVMLAEVYHEAVYVQYRLQDDVLTLWYPEQSAELIAQVAVQLEKDAEYIIDRIPQDAEIEDSVTADLIVKDNAEEAAVSPAEEEIPAAVKLIDSITAPNAEERAEEPISEIAVTEEQETAAETAPVENACLFEEVFSYKGITSGVMVYSDHAVLTIPKGTTGDDISCCASLLIAAYPEAAAVTYRVEDGVVILYYPEQDEAFLRGAYSVLVRDAEMFIDSITVKAEEPAPEETPVSPVSEEQAEPVKEEASADIPAVVEKKAAVIKNWSASGTFNAAYNVAGFGIKAKGINLGVGARAEMEILDRFWVGAKFAFNFRFGYIQADFFSRYEFAEYRQSDFYAFLALGGDYTIEAKKFSFVVEIGAGYEYNFTPDIAAFVEISTQYSWIRRFDINGNIGVRYAF